MTKLTLYVFLLIIFTSVATEVNKTIIEIEGCFTLNTYNSSFKLSLLEKVAIPVCQHLYASVCGEQSLRNRSLENSLFCGAEYHLGQKKFQIPLGIFTGLHSFHIGQYTSSVPVGGINTGLIVWLTRQTSLRVNYLAKLYFDKQTIFGSDVYIGFSFAILREHTNTI